MEILDQYTWILVLSVIAGFVFSFGLGANDMVSSIALKTNQILDAARLFIRVVWSVMPNSQLRAIVVVKIGL